jgi:peptide/nickel transport system permease protein
MAARRAALTPLPPSPVEPGEGVAAQRGGTVGVSTQASLVSEAARRPRRVNIWSGIRRQKLAMTGIIIVAFFALVALVGPAIAPYGPTEQFIDDRLQPPGGKYLLGTDEFGRDIYSRLLYGARISFQVGAIAVGIAGSLGIVFGLIAGYARGWIDNVLTLLMDVIFAFPAILLAIAIISLLGNNLANAMIAIAIVYMPTFMRVVRGATLSVRNTAYVESAVALGASTPRVLLAHVFPNITAPLIVHVSLVFAFAVLAEASLAFLGLGNKPPAPSWGSMVSASYGFLQLAPWAAIVPGVAIALAVLGFNLLGDGLRDALDPRTRGL